MRVTIKAPISPTNPTKSGSIQNTNMRANTMFQNIYLL